MPQTVTVLRQPSRFPKRSTHRYLLQKRLIGKMELVVKRFRLYSSPTYRHRIVFPEWKRDVQDNQCATYAPVVQRDNCRFATAIVRILPE